MIRLFVCSWLVVLIGVASTVSSAVAGQEQTRLEALLPQHCFFTGNFLQKRNIKSLPAPLVSQGRFFYSCRAGLIWHIDSPIMETLIYTQAGLQFEIRPGQQPKQINSRLHSYLSVFLLNLMAANTDYLYKNFKVDEASSSVELDKASKGSLIRLTPLSKSVRRGLKKIELKEEGSNRIIRIVNVNQESTELIISDVEKYIIGDNQIASSACSSVSKENSLLCDVLLQPQRYLSKN
ncbi:MAG: hypothetical protein GXP21_02020 [Gammaproteobacteria bacterium]|nr:hypothetical protein [Gammaproteobacteria bacterium]